MNIRENLGLLYAIMNCNDRGCSNCALQERCKNTNSTELRNELFNEIRANISHMEAQNAQER